MDVNPNPSTPLSAAQLVERFTDYLADRLPAASAEEYLTLILRTDGQVHLTPTQIAKICFQWALKQRDAQHIPVYESLSTALLRIYQADGLCSLPHFELNRFIKPFVSELFALCPDEEKPLLKADLPEVKKRFEKSLETSVEKQMQEFEVELRVDEHTTVTEGEWIELTGQRFKEAMDALTRFSERRDLPAAEQIAAVNRLMPPVRESFENIIDPIVLKDRLGQLIWPALTMFNRGDIEPANIILEYVADTVDRRKDQFLEKAVASILSLDKLNNDLIRAMLDDPRKKGLLKPIFSNIMNTRPHNLLARLVQEENPEERKKLISYITVYEPEIFHRILDELESPAATKWYYKRNLILLTTLVRRPDDIPVARIFDSLLVFVHPEINPRLMEESIRACFYLDWQQALSLYLEILNAGHLSEVIRLDRFYPPQELEAFRQSILDAACSYDFSNNLEAVGAILDMVREEMSKVKLTLGKRGVGLDQRLVDALLNLLSASHSPQVARILQDLAAETRIASVQQSIQRVTQALWQARKSFM